MTLSELLDPAIAKALAVAAVIGILYRSLKTLLEFYDEYLGKRKFKRHTFLREEADQNRELASFIESIRHEIVFRTAFGKSASPRMAAAVMVAYQSGHFSLEELRASFFYWKLGDDGSITVEPGMAGWILVGTIGFFMIAITLYSGLVIYELLSANSLPAFAMAFALFVVVLIYFQHFGREARAVFAARRVKEKISKIQLNPLTFPLSGPPTSTDHAKLQQPPAPSQAIDEDFQNP